MKKIKLMSFLTVFLAVFAFYGVNPSIVMAQESVNTCTDGIDNDFNSVADDADPSCANSSTQEGALPTLPPVIISISENTYALCTDGLDNDFNTMSDDVDPSCASVLAPAPTPMAEITLALCTDGLDNDFNTMSDGADPSCFSILAVVNNENSTPTGTPENTYILCNDGLDNDFNTMSDDTDPSCANVQAPTTTPTTGGGGGGTPTTVGPTGGSGPVTSSTGGSNSGGLTTGTPISTTVTQPAMCPDRMLIKTYLRHGRNNNLADMLRLKSFLNRNLGLKLEVNGTFDMSTFNAVKTFQSKYKNEVLLPWDLAGAAVDLVNNPTGYVYKTTKRQINMLICPGLNLPMPLLP